ncbi:MAG: hypothetical protein RLZZ15_2739 [Verrucomicrobiota bacterium]|jgi:arylsulfatase A-like enzyme
MALPVGLQVAGRRLPKPSPMKKIPALPALALAVACALLAPRLHAAAAPRPNLIIINIDDLGYGEIGPFGGRIATPALDRMAAEGRKLTSHYAAPVCSPSRAALLTGSYAKRALPIPHVLFPASAVGLHPAERTIAEILRDAGYATAMIGKWHLGDQPEFLPTAQGFETYFGLPYSNDMGPRADGVKTDRVLAGATPAPEAAAANANAKAKAGAKKKAVANNNSAASAPNAVAPAPNTATNTAPPAPVATGQTGDSQPPLPLLEGDSVIARVRHAEQIDLQRRYTERAVDFVRAPRDRPFFLYLAPNAVHFPRYPRDEFLGKSGHGLLGDWIQEIDWTVGQLLGALREAHLAANTLVLFTSDNGGPVNQGAINTPLRGSKGTTWEGGVRVPLLAWWPGKIPAGTSTDAMSAMMDVLPTFAKLAGTTAPTDRKIDGVDLWPILVGNPATAPRDEFFFYRGLALEAVRSGPWKLHLASGELYHLGRDLAEARNLAAENPAEVQRLRARAETMRDDLGLDGIGPGCRPLGRAANPRPLIPADAAVPTK